ncbi:MAG: hypothetical protein ACFFBD_13370 [Candidatus Hodarchaeota archaeon]
MKKTYFVCLVCVISLFVFPPLISSQIRVAGAAEIRNVGFENWTSGSPNY